MTDQVSSLRTRANQLRRGLSRWRCDRRYRKRRPRLEWLNGEFYRAVTTTDDLHSFFRTAASEQEFGSNIPNSVSGHCYVCQKAVELEVNVSQVTQFGTWRETLKCGECGLINRWRSSIHILEALINPQLEDRLYMTEAVTPLYRAISVRHRNTVGSEFSSGAEPGEVMELPWGPIRNEDITRLSFADGSFEVVLSFDVLEHVPDFRKALSEIHRVLVAGGHAMISVPSTFNDTTVTRAVVDESGQIKHLLEPQYHGDPLSDQGVLCFHEFGLDLIDEMKAAGFAEAFAVAYTSSKWGYFGEQLVFMGRKC